MIDVFRRDIAWRGMDVVIVLNLRLVGKDLAGNQESGIRITLLGPMASNTK